MIFFSLGGNHLGNVRAVVSDRRGYVSIAGDLSITNEPELVAWTDYYAYGMRMNGRSESTSEYRYSFNGMEHDDEVSGGGNSYTTEFRQYASRVARWLSIDPVTHHYQSPYNAFDGNPIYFADPSGADVNIVDPTDPPGKKVNGADGNNYYIPENSNVTKFSKTSLNISGIGSAVVPENSVRKFTLEDGSIYHASWKKGDDGTAIFNGYKLLNSDGSLSGVGWAGRRTKTVTETVMVESEKMSYTPLLTTGGVLIADDATVIGVLDDVLLVGVGLGLIGTWIYNLGQNEAYSYSSTYEVDVPYPVELPIGNLIDPPVDYFFHYTNVAGVAGIVGTGAIFPNSKGKTYMTKSVLSPTAVENTIFIGNPLYSGRGDQVVMFYVTASQRAMIMKDPSSIHEYIYTAGTLRINGQILYFGPNLVR